MDNDGAAKDALGANQLDELVGDRALSIALAVGLEVAQVADVAVGVGGSTVALAVGVDCGILATALPTGGFLRLAVGAGRGAAVGVVAKGVDVHATLSVGIVAGDVP